MRRFALCRTTGVALLAAALPALLGSVAVAQDVRLDALLSTRFEYYDEEDLFGGTYAPFYQFMDLSVKNLYGDRLRFHANVYGTQDLAGDGDEFYGDVYSLYAELRDLSALSRARVGRFVLTSGIGFNAVDGADAVFKLGGKADAEFYAGRNKVFYDTRFTETPLDRAPFTDTGFVYGSSLRLKPAGDAALRIGYHAFDSDTEAGTQDYLTYGFFGDLRKNLRLEISGYEDLSDGSGSEVRAEGIVSVGQGGKVRMGFDHYSPDRVNPEIITSIFVADSVSSFGGGIEAPLNERLNLFGDYALYAFDTPGGLDPSRRSQGVSAGLSGNYWTDRGLTFRMSFRYLTGEPGDLRQLTFTGEKRLTGYLSAGWSFDYVNYREEEGSERENAYIVNGRVKLFLHRDVWILWEVEDYSNIDFDYNLRTRLTLNLRLANERQ